MANDIKVELDTKAFDAALNKYMDITSKSIVDVLNMKAYVIAAESLNATIKTNPQDIERDLGKVIAVKWINKKGKQKTSKQISGGVKSRTTSAPLAVLLVNKRQGKLGKPGLYGNNMKAAIIKLINRRKKSVAFLRSGWVPAIKILSRLAKNASTTPQDTTMRGEAKGGAIPARDELVSWAEIWNSVKGGKQESGFVHKKLQEALQFAIDKETASMYEYMERKLQEAADKTINK